MAAFRFLAATLAAVTLVDHAQAWTVDLPSCTSPFQPFVYSGCYSDAGGSTPALGFKSTLPRANMTVEKCVAECKGNSYRYAGLEYYGDCYCGQSVAGSPVAESSCSYPCAGNKSETCGGSNIISIYQDPTFPTTTGSGTSDYVNLGCWTDDSSTGRALSFPQDAINGNSLTIETCLTTCKAGGFPLAGVEYGQQCWCGVVIGNGTFAAPASDCSMTCKGDATENCGGRARLNLFVATDLESLEPCGYVSSSSSSALPSTSSTSTLSTSVTVPATTTTTTAAVSTSTSTSSVDTSSTAPASTSTSSTAPATTSTSSTVPATTSTSTTPATTSSSTSSVDTSSTAPASTSTSSTAPATTSTSTSTAPATTSTSTAPATTSTSTAPATTSTSSSTSSSTSTSTSTTLCTTSTTSKATTSTAPVTTSAPPTTTTKPTTTSTSSLCTATVTIPSTCEYGCGSWCSSSIPDFDDNDSCYDSHSNCKIQVAACFKNAGWPGSMKCFDFSDWCGSVNSYCGTKDTGSTWGKSDCIKRSPPSGGKPPTTTTSVYPCAPTTTSKPGATSTKKTTTTSAPTKCPIPTPTSICKQASNPWNGYDTNSPVGGIDMPVVTCNDLQSEWSQKPFKLYRDSDSTKCSGYPRGSVPSACADACKAQYDDCSATYVSGCKANDNNNGGNNGGSGGGGFIGWLKSLFGQRRRSYFEYAGTPTVLKRTLSWSDNSKTATNKCTNQYNDCLSQNKYVSSGSKCYAYNSGW